MKRSLKFNGEQVNLKIEGTQWDNIAEVGEVNKNVPELLSQLQELYTLISKYGLILPTENSKSVRGKGNKRTGLQRITLHGLGGEVNKKRSGNVI